MRGGVGVKGMKFVLEPNPVEVEGNAVGPQCRRRILCIFAPLQPEFAVLLGQDPFAAAVFPAVTVPGNLPVARG